MITCTVEGLHEFVMVCSDLWSPRQKLCILKDNSLAIVKYGVKFPNLFGLHVNNSTHWLRSLGGGGGAARPRGGGGGGGWGV